MSENPTSRTPIDWQQFRRVIDEAKSVLLVSHIRPDGDAIGSQIAMAAVLDELGKNVIIVNAYPVSPNIQFIDPERRILLLSDLTDEQRATVAAVDLIISLDTSSWAQLGEMGDVFKASSAKKIVLDHHIPSDDVGAESFVDSSAEAAGSLVFQAAKVLGVPLSRRIAFPLFAAIATDTGWFRFSSVKPTTFQTIAELVEAGVRPDEIYKQIYEQETIGRLRLIGRALEKAEPFLDGKGFWTTLSLDDFDCSNAIPSDSEDVVNMLLQVQDSEVAVILVEQRTGGFKLSFRSRCELDCSRLAKRLGGGGHQKAAGAFIDEPLDAALQKTLLLTQEEYRSSKLGKS